MDTMTDTTIRCILDDGREMTLDAEDCATLLNAMARSRLLEVMIVNIPDSNYAAIDSDECVAWAMTGDDADNGDSRVYLEVDAGRFTCATPREKPKRRRKLTGG